MCQKKVMQDEVIAGVMAWIENNIESRIQVADIAARSGYSHWHIQRLFKQVTSRTLGRYIRERKLLLAARALAKTNEAVVHIALRYGFDSQHTFTRQFTRHFSAPPGKWRKAGANRWPSFVQHHPDCGLRSLPCG